MVLFQVIHRSQGLFWVLLLLIYYYYYYYYYSLPHGRNSVLLLLVLSSAKPFNGFVSSYPPIPGILLGLITTVIVTIAFIIAIEYRVVVAFCHMAAIRCYFHSFIVCLTSSWFRFKSSTDPRDFLKSSFGFLVDLSWDFRQFHAALWL